MTVDRSGKLNDIGKSESPTSDGLNASAEDSIASIDVVEPTTNDGCDTSEKEEGK